LKSFRESRRRATAASAAAIGVALLMGAAALSYGLYASATTSGEISTMSSSLSSQRAEIGALNSTVGSLQANVTSLQDKLVSVGTKLNSTETTVASLKGNVTSLQDKLVSVGSQLSSTQALVASLRANVTSLQEKLVAVSGQLNATQLADSSAITQLQAEVQSLNATIQALTNQLAALTLPALLEQAESTCSYVCTQGSTNATFPADVRQGNMLVITVVSDDLTNLIVTDSLGTRISLAVSATTSPACTSNTGTCQADIYWGLLPSSGTDTVSVSEGSSTRALRIEIWEFSGVDTVKSTVSCSPICASASFASPGVLIATARDVTGAGLGFTWYPYAASGVAGTEYQVVSGSGTTAFPFSAGVNDVEAGAVLGLTS